MKTLILYASKHGAAKEIAEGIAGHIPGSTLRDLKSNSIPDISQFDCVVIGSSLYAGSILKEAKTFLSQNTEALRKKRLGLFLSGMDAKSEKSFFESNFSSDILQAARVKSFLGGVFDPKKSGAIGRFIMKIAAKQSGYINTISDDKILQFAEAMKR